MRSGLRWYRAWGLRISFEAARAQRRMSVAWCYWGDEPSINESVGSSKNFLAKVGSHGRFMSETIRSWCGMLSRRGKQYPCNHQNGVCRPLRWFLKRTWLKPWHWAYLHSLTLVTIMLVKHWTGILVQPPTLQKLGELRCQSRSQNTVDCCQNQRLTYGCGSPARDLFFSVNSAKAGSRFSNICRVILVPTSQCRRESARFILKNDKPDTWKTARLLLLVVKRSLEHCFCSHR